MSQTHLESREVDGEDADEDEALIAVRRRKMKRAQTQRQHMRNEQSYVLLKRRLYSRLSRAPVVVRKHDQSNPKSTHLKPASSRQR